jgi:oligopeptide/dipeptide ABC transporter ATP-binding protein
LRIKPPALPEHATIAVVAPASPPQTRSESEQVPEAGSGGRRELLSGELPDATDVPSGCRFHPRCPKRFEPCDRVDPPLYAAGGRDQVAACLLHDPTLGREGVEAARS